MGKPRKYTEAEFIKAVKDSKSYRSVLHILGLKEAGGNYRVMKERANDLGLDMSHFTGKGHLKNGHHNWAVKIPLEQVMVIDSSYGSFKLKTRLLKDGIFEHKCCECGNTIWRDKPIPLELEHKNGNNRDNRIENLCMLCPNCHALTDTYRGKNIGRSGVTGKPHGT